MNKHNIQVGQKVWVVQRLHRSVADPKEVEVLKVGRKYFEVSLNGRWNEKYDLENLRQEVASNYKNQIYLTLQEILDEKELSVLSTKIRMACGQYGNLPFTLDQLRKIAEIINITQ